MPNYQSPGVYIEEVSKGPKPIAGVPTNVAAIVGKTERGPALEPTRLTSWNDYLALFGGYVEGSFTPENVFGFFQNGGTALWMVRADNATRRTWLVRQATNANRDLFEVRASSPGEWANGLAVDVFRETAGVRGQFYSASVKGPGATVNLNGGLTVTVNVSSTIGLRVGSTVVFADADSTGTAIRGSVVGVSTDAITVIIAGSATNSVTVARDARVFGRYNNGDPELVLASGGGFFGGDLVVARTPQGILAEATVDRATSQIGGGTTLALVPGFGVDVPGLQLADRTYDLEVNRTVSTRFTELTQLVLPALTPALTEADIFRLVSSSGVEATFDATATPDRWDFGFPVPSGPVTVSIRARVAPYSEPISPGLTLAAAATAAEVAAALARFSFVPTGGTLRLAPGNKDFVRTASGWTAPADPSGTFTSATYQAAPAQPLLALGPVQPREGDWIELGAAANRAQVKTSVVPEGAPADTFLVTFETAPAAITGTSWPLLVWQPTTIEPLRFGIRASLVSGGVETQSEEFHGLSLNPNHPNYFFRDGVVNEVSRLVEVGERMPTGAITRTSYPADVVAPAPAGAGSINPELIRQAFERLESVQEPAMLACPDALQLDAVDRVAAVNSMIAHAESFRRFAVVDAPTYRDDPSLDDDLLNWRLDTVASTYAATYAPFVRILNPRPNAVARTIDVPPSGFVMGVIARTDVERGVWKAPANEQVRGAVGLASTFSQRRQDLLNPGGVNLLRAFRGRGIRVWGARNSTDDTQWRYVNVRRLFLFLENSIERSTQWVVFEPNNETTWLRVRVSVENFLNGIWRQGGLLGTTPEQAYRVRVGLGQTMTETDIDLGYLIIEVAVAPTKPAEFVVFQISHKRLAE